MLEWIISSSALILAVIAGRRLLRGRIGLRLQYALWAVVLVRLLLPVNLFESVMSVQNLKDQAMEAEPVQQLYQAVQPAPSDQSYDQVMAQLIAQYQAQGVDVAALPEAERQEVELQARQQFEAQSQSPMETIRGIGYWVWVAGMAAMALCLIGSNLSFSRRLRRSRREVEIPGSPVTVYISGAVQTPCLFGCIHPAIYLTPEAAEDERVMGLVLAHEITHYRHFDYLWSALRGVCLVVHWYNPLVWLAAKLSRQDGELACDEGALECIGEEARLDYGRTLIGLSCKEKSDGILIAATTMTGSAKELKDRLVLLMKRPRTAAVTAALVLIVTAVLVGCTFSGAVEDVPQESIPPETTEPAVSVPTIPKETTVPEETIQPIEPAPVISIPLGAEILNAEQIAQVNEAFATPVFVEQEDGTVKAKLNPIHSFFITCYESVEEINLMEFLLYCQEGAVFVGEDSPEIDALKALEGTTLSDGTVYNFYPYQIKRIPASVVDGLFQKYAGISLDDVSAAGKSVAGLTYLPEYDAYYKSTHDANWGEFRCVSGYILEDQVVLFSDYDNTALTLRNRDGRYYIESHVPAVVSEIVALSQDQIDQVNEAFATVLYRQENGVQVPYTNPIHCFFLTYFDSVQQINLPKLMRYADGEEPESAELVGLKRHCWEPLSDGTRNYAIYGQAKKHLAEDMDAMLRKYTGVSLNELDGAGKSVPGLLYLEDYDAYYVDGVSAWEADDYQGEFHCVGGYIYGDRVLLYSDRMHSVLTLRNVDGTYYIESHRSALDADGVALTEEQVEQVNLAFRNLPGEPMDRTNPAANFFTSYYFTPQEIDLSEFMRYFTAEGIVEGGETSTYVESDAEYQLLRQTEGWSFSHIEALDALPVPLHRYSPEVMDAVIFRYMGIHLDDLQEAGKTTPGLYYVAETDAYYNCTSDAGGGSFACSGGMIFGDRVELYSGSKVLTLRAKNGRYYFYSYLPAP